MTLLLDFLPIILFFGTFKFAGAQKEWATNFANQHFGFLVSGGVVGPDEAPVLLATLVVIAAMVVQVGVTLARGKKVDKIVWLSFAIIVVLGAATVWFHNETFIKWKPTAINWVLAVAFAGSQLLFKKNLIRATMGQQIQLPDPIWNRLNLSWIAFFVLMGAANLYVAYNFSLETWVDFKFYGGIGLPMLFIVLMTVYLARHIRSDEDDVAPKRSS